jgi:hypothetical protein
MRGLGPPPVACHADVAARSIHQVLTLSGRWSSPHFPQMGL